MSEATAPEPASEATAPEPAPPSGDRPHVLADGDYFCPAHGIFYAERRRDEAGVERCLACGAPVTDWDNGPGR